MGESNSDISPTPPPRSRSSSPDNLRPSNSNALETWQAPEPRKESGPNMYPNRERERETVVMPPGGFPTQEKAEAAFVHLLKKEGIDETWTWDQTMRKIIMDPLYKALDTLAEKKSAFENVSLSPTKYKLYLMTVHSEYRRREESGERGQNCQIAANTASNIRSFA